MACLIISTILSFFTAITLKSPRTRPMLTNKLCMVIPGADIDVEVKSVMCIISIMFTVLWCIIGNVITFRGTDLMEVVWNNDANLYLGTWLSFILVSWLFADGCVSSSLKSSQSSADHSSSSSSSNSTTTLLRPIRRNIVKGYILNFVFSMLYVGYLGITLDSPTCSGDKPTILLCNNLSLGIVFGSLGIAVVLCYYGVRIMRAYHIAQYRDQQLIHGEKECTVSISSIQHEWNSRVDKVSIGLSIMNFVIFGLNAGYVTTSTSVANDDSIMIRNIYISSWMCFVWSVYLALQHVDIILLGGGCGRNVEVKSLPTSEKKKKKNTNINIPLINKMIGDDGSTACASALTDEYTVLVDEEMGLVKDVEEDQRSATTTETDDYVFESDSSKSTGITPPPRAPPIMSRMFNYRQQQQPACPPAPVPRRSSRNIPPPPVDPQRALNEHCRDHFTKAKKGKGNDQTGNDPTTKKKKKSQQQQQQSASRKVTPTKQRSQKKQPTPPSPVQSKSVSPRPKREATPPKRSTPNKQRPRKQSSPPVRQPSTGSQHQNSRQQSPPKEKRSSSRPKSRSRVAGHQIIHPSKVEPESSVSEASSYAGPSEESNNTFDTNFLEGVRQSELKQRAEEELYNNVKNSNTKSDKRGTSRRESLVDDPRHNVDVRDLMTPREIPEKSALGNFIEDIMQAGQAEDKEDSLLQSWIQTTNTSTTDPDQDGVSVITPLPGISEKSAGSTESAETPYMPPDPFGYKNIREKSLTPPKKSEIVKLLESEMAKLISPIDTAPTEDVTRSSSFNSSSTNITPTPAGALDNTSTTRSLTDSSDSKTPPSIAKLRDSISTRESSTTTSNSIAVSSTGLYSRESSTTMSNSIAVSSTGPITVDDTCASPCTEDEEESIEAAPCIKQVGTERNGTPDKKRRTAEELVAAVLKKAEQRPQKAASTLSKSRSKEKIAAMLEKAEHRRKKSNELEERVKDEPGNKDGKSVHTTYSSERSSEPSIDLVFDC